MTTSFLAVKEDSQANNEDSALTLHSQTIDGKLDEKFDEGLLLYYFYLIYYLIYVL